MAKPKYPRNPIKRRPVPASGGTYKRVNGQLTKQNEPGAAPKTETKDEKVSGNVKKEE